MNAREQRIQQQKERKSIQSYKLRQKQAQERKYYIQSHTPSGSQSNEYINVSQKIYGRSLRGKKETRKKKHDNDKERS